MSLTDRILLRIDAESHGAVTALRQTRREMERTSVAAGKANTHVARTSDKATVATKGLHRSQSALLGGLKLTAGAIGAYGLAGAFTTMISESEQARKVSAQTNAVLKSTGGVANVTRRQILALADAQSKKIGVDDEEIQQAENLLATFTKVRNERGKGNKAFNEATIAAENLSAALGQNLQQSAIQVGMALNDPVKGITRLQRVGVSFTAQQKDQIKALVDSGKQLQAQKLILRELNTEFGGVAAAKATPLDHLKVSALNLAETLGKDLAPEIDSAAKTATTFIDQMQNGTGTGGKFAHALGDAADGAKDVVHEVTPAVKWVAKLVDEHPEIMKVAGGFLAVGAAVKAITFASKISGLSVFLKAAKLGAAKFVALWATAGAEAGAAAGTELAAGENLASARAGAGKLGKAAGAAFKLAWNPYVLAAAASLYVLWQALHDSKVTGDPATGGLPGKKDAARPTVTSHQWNKAFPGAKLPGTGDGPGRPGAFTGDGPGASARAAGVSLMGSKPGLQHYASVAAGYGLHVSSGRRPGAITSAGNVSYHSTGDAIDVADGTSGPSPAKMNFARAMVSRYGSQLEELIYTPLGFSIKDGRKVAPYAASEHYDHVHVADTNPSASAAGDGPGASGWKDGTCTWYKPSAGGINGSEGAGAWPGHPIYDSTWGCAAPPAFAFGTRIEFRYQGRSVLVPVVDRGGAIQGTHFDLLPGPAARLGMQGAGKVAVRFRTRGRDGAMVSRAARAAASAKRRQAAARHRSGVIKHAAGVRRSVNTSRGDRIEAGFEDRFTLAGLTTSRADDYRTAQQGLAYWQMKVRQYQYGLTHGDHRVTGDMLREAISQRDTWQDRVNTSNPLIAPDIGGALGLDNGPGSATPTADQQAALDQQQRVTDALRQTTSVLAQQVEAFKGFAPLAGMRFVGSFAKGGLVPATGLALLHRDEVVVPDPAGPFGNQAGGAAAPVTVHLQLHGDAGNLVKLIDARVDGRAARVTSEQLGRRQRVLSIAPGSRRS